MTGTGVKQLPDTQVNFSPFTEFTLVLLDPELTLVLLIPLLKKLDPDQLAFSEAILSGSTLFSILIENTRPVSCLFEQI